MAKRRRTKASNPNGVTAPQGAQKNPAKSPNSNSQANRSSDFALWATIFCATLVAYLPAVQGSPLWDDKGHLTRPDLQAFHGLWRIWFELGATQQYYPLLHSAFWLEHLVWGDAVAGYHLTNIALHALSACLVVMIMRRLSLPGAWLAGFVFALHPVNVESVAWISEQKNTLSGVFCLASLLTYLHFDEDRRKSRYLLATGLFVLALLSKTVTATLPAVLLVIFWYRRGRIEWKRDALPLLPWFAVGIFAGLFTSRVESTFGGASGTDFLLTPVQRLLIAGRAICFYAGKLLWPANLTFFYPQWKVDPAVWWQWLFPAVVLALGIGLVLAARRYCGPLAGFLIFAGTLFPVLGFLNVYPFRYSFVADHFQYLACLGIIVPIVSVLVAAINRHSSAKAVTIACSVTLIMVLGVLTWRQSRMYRDIETLYRESLKRNPASWVLHNNLGTLLADMPGRLPEAIAEYQQAMQIRPDYAETHANLGSVWARTPGRMHDAIAEYQEAVRLRPDFAEARTNLGFLLASMPGRLPDAVSEYRAALKAKPDYAEAHNNLGTLLAAMPGRLPDAIVEYQAALRAKPDYAEAHNNLGIALSRTPGRLPDAIAEYKEALRIKPDYAEAHDNLGNALSQIPGRLAEAIAEHREALRIKPDYAEAHDNLGNALSQMPGRFPEAIAEYQEALRIKPNYSEAHYNLGTLLAGMPGRLPDAIAEYREAIRIRPDYAEAHTNLGTLLAGMPGRLPEAIAEFRAAIRFRPDYPEAYNDLGVVLAGTGRLQDAIAQYQEALRIRPDYAGAHFNLGDALAKIPGRSAEAIAEYQAAIRIRPDYAGLASERMRMLGASRLPSEK